jgi:hypothetical protein
LARTSAGLVDGPTPILNARSESEYLSSHSIESQRPGSLSNGANS